VKKNLVISKIAAAFAAGCLLFAGCEPSPRATPWNTSPVVPTESAVVASFTPTNHLDPSLLQSPAEPFTLGPGDRVEIQLLTEPVTRTTCVIGPDGKLYFDLLPGLDVWGLTLAQTKDLIEKNYAQYVRQPPRVSIILREVASRHIWILGRVQAPGVYSMTAPMTLLEAVSLAGGTMSLASYRDQEAAGVGEELADLKRSFIVREGKFIPVNFDRLLRQGDLSQNIYLQPDDFIYFPSAATKDVYVLGAVNQPRKVPWHEGLTVGAAIASTYGTLKESYLSHVALVRGALSQPHLTVVNYSHIVRGMAPDIPLEPGDIVYVPLSPYRYIDHYLEVILNTFVSSASINAGTSLIGVPTTGAAGIFIPVGSGVQVIPPTAPPPIH
jgi:polysaccharide biosynthesis/export protein